MVTVTTKMNVKRDSVRIGLIMVFDAILTGRQTGRGYCELTSASCELRAASYEKKQIK